MSKLADLPAEIYVHIFRFIEGKDELINIREAVFENTLVRQCLDTVIFHEVLVIPPCEMLSTENQVMLRNPGGGSVYVSLSGFQVMDTFEMQYTDINDLKPYKKYIKSFKYQARFNLRFDRAEGYFYGEHDVMRFVKTLPSLESLNVDFGYHLNSPIKKLVLETSDPQFGFNPQFIEHLTLKTKDTESDGTIDFSKLTLPNLKTLELDCFTNHVVGGDWSTSPNLQEVSIKCRHNIRLENFHSKNFPSLKKLKLHTAWETICVLGTIMIESLEDIEVYDVKIDECGVLRHCRNLKQIKSNNVEINLEELSSLRKVRTLKFYGNHVHHLMELKDFQELEEAEIQRGHISVLVYNSNRLPKLKKLDVSHNEIEAIGNINNLDGIEELDLNSNRLNSIKGLEVLGRSLKKLNLSWNKLTKIQGFNGLANIESLNLSSNRISVLGKLGHLVNLKALDVTNCDITRIQNLGRLKCLKQLKLSRNKIAVVENLDGLESLQKLKLESNSIVKIKQLGNLPSLEEINLSENKLDIVENLYNLPSLRILNFSRNAITNAHEQDFSGFQNLEVLDVSFNEISTMPVLEHMRNLREVNLSNNSIEMVENIGYLPQLSKLSFSTNSITVCKPLIGLENLQTIVMRSNKLMDTRWAYRCNNLRKLILAENQLGTFPEITHWKYLAHLDLTRNEIKSVEINGHFENLTFLCLSGNIISTIKLSRFNNLHNLDIGNNKLTSMRGLLELKSLRTLSVERNSLKEIPKLTRFTKLSSLDFSFNKVSQVAQISGMKSLWKLKATNCGLTNMKFIGLLKSLKVLDLAANRLEKIEGNINNFSRLLELFLSENQISKVENIWGLHELDLLDLSHNKLKEIRHLDRLQTLKTLFLNHNELTVATDLEGFFFLKQLDLSYNKLTNTSQYEDLARYVDVYMNADNQEEEDDNGYMFGDDLGNPAMLDSINAIFGGGGSIPSMGGNSQVDVTEIMQAYMRQFGSGNGW
ncbi:hypothetical protein DASC09_047790 [Saccharomycopsis crataegensis]|uniref:Uncharacterized protein n=1 Tax=Saccharomycopsis crataegensis TaxID=43959 RepID=A0AAV5QSL0_9ASCO|nr:hypothetical protein DASC09_047790 [Saccharomycopsis crataegensis]